MKDRVLRGFCTFVWVALLAFLLNACGSTSGVLGVEWGQGDQPHASKRGKKAGKGPPAHAAAYGQRVEHHYRYYYSAHVYYDVDRKLYFFPQKEKWLAATGLPRRIRISYDDYVTIVMESDRPYHAFKQHKSQYPPGHRKKKAIKG